MYFAIKGNWEIGKRETFSSLYWNFYAHHEPLLGSNARIQMMYNVWRKMDPEQKAALLTQAEYYLERVDEL